MLYFLSFLLQMPWTISFFKHTILILLKQVNIGHSTLIRSCLNLAIYIDNTGGI